MKDYLNTIRFHSQVPISGENKKGILQEMTALIGVEGLHVGFDFVEIDYYPQFQSVDTLKQALNKMVFDFRETKHKSERGFFKELISNMAKENKKTFGSKGPSCCG